MMTSQDKKVLLKTESFQNETFYDAQDDESTLSQEKLWLETIARLSGFHDFIKENEEEFSKDAWTKKRSSFRNTYAPSNETVLDSVEGRGADYSPTKLSRSESPTVHSFKQNAQDEDNQPTKSTSLFNRITPKSILRRNKQSLLSTNLPSISTESNTTHASPSKSNQSPEKFAHVPPYPFANTRQVSGLTTIASSSNLASSDHGALDDSKLQSHPSFIQLSASQKSLHSALGTDSVGTKSTLHVPIVPNSTNSSQHSLSVQNISPKIRFQNDDIDDNIQPQSENPQDVYISEQLSGNRSKINRQDEGNTIRKSCLPPLRAELHRYFSDDYIQTNYSHHLNNIQSMKYLQLNQAESKFQNKTKFLREKYGFTRGMVNHLQSYPLRIWIVDNSGSMTKGDGRKLIDDEGRAAQIVNCTRWEELVSAVLFHARLARDMGAPTVFRLLNVPQRTSSEETLTQVVGVCARPKKINDLQSHYERKKDLLTKKNRTMLTKISFLKTNLWTQNNHVAKNASNTSTTSQWEGDWIIDPMPNELDYDKSEIEAWEKRTNKDYDEVKRVMHKVSLVCNLVL